MAADCPCGSGDAFADCCRPLLRGEREAVSASALMRSRYCAYVRRDETYLLRTWDPSTRPSSLDLEEISWRGLDVTHTTAGESADATGTVAFAAHFVDATGIPGTMREVSRFRRLEGRWVYVDVEVT